MVRQVNDMASWKMYKCIIIANAHMKCFVSEINCKQVSGD